MKRQSNTGIYKWTSPSGKSYIGQAKDLDKRKKLFLSNPYIYNYTSVEGESRIDKARRKYPNFNEWKYEIIEYCSTDELNEKEIYYIDYFDTFNNGYNCTLGGEGRKGATNSESQKKIISERAVKTNKEIKAIRWSLIEEYYDSNLSVKENIEIINENCFKVSKSTIYNFLKENGLKTDNNKLTDEELLNILDVNLSVRKNLEILKDNNIKISKDRINKLLNQLKDNNNDSISINIYNNYINNNTISINSSFQSTTSYANCQNKDTKNTIQNKPLITITEPTFIGFDGDIRRNDLSKNGILLYTVNNREIA